MKIFPEIIRIPDRITIERGGEKVSFDGAERIVLDDIVLTLDNGKITLTADKSEVNGVTLFWKCRMPDGCMLLGDEWERGYGKMEWRGLSSYRPMPWYFTASCGDKTWCCGVKTMADSMCCFKCHKGGITLECDTRCGQAGVVLGGRTIVCGELVNREYEGISAFEAQHDFAGLLAVNPVFPEKPVYGYNNWYYAYGRSSHEEILQNAAQLARLTKGVENRPYMVVDDCWQIKHWFRGGYNGGPWREGNEAFPDMKKLADEIAAMDVIPGIWFRPLQNADESIDEKYYTNREEFILDPTYPEVLDYVAQDVKTIIGWGYRLIKHDFTSFDILNQWGLSMGGRVSGSAYTFRDNSLTNAQIIKKVYKTIYDAADGKAIIIGCNCFGHLGTGYFHIHRSGDDTSGRAWERTRDLGVNTLAFRAHQHGKFYFADADCVGITPKIDFEQNKEFLTLVAKSGTPLFISVSPTTMTEKQEEYVSEMLKEASKPHKLAEPLDWMLDTLPSKWSVDGKETEFNWYK